MTAAAAELPCLPRTPYLGPARVLSRGGDHLAVVVPGCRATGARLALAVPCLLEEGCEVLVLGEPGALFVIGVLSERRLAIEGRSVSIRARGAHLRMSGDQGVHLSGRALTLLATDTLEIAAHRVHEVVGSLHRLVHGRATRVASELDQIAHGAWALHARAVVLKVRDAVRVQGKVIRAG